MINKEMIEKFAEGYKSDPRAVAAACAVAKSGISAASLDPNLRQRHSFVFSVETEKGEITNQKASGRCWMFAALNSARVRVMKKLNLENFEFSQTYSFFWDKLEKSNFFLASIIKTADEDLDSRLVNHLLKDPLQDGGQWDMYTGLLAKYGAVPKHLMPETFSSTSSGQLCEYLTSKLREYAKELRAMHKEGKGEEAIGERRTEMLAYIYKVLVMNLGEPPKKFSFGYRDKDKKYGQVKDITPQDFFKEYVGWNLDDMISLIHAPTKDKPFGHRYTVKFLGSVEEANPINYVNVELDAMKKAAIKSLQDGEPVWFGCDVGKRLVTPDSIMDEGAFKYEEVLGEGLTLNKAERLDYGDSILTHAMLFIGVDLDENGKPINWKVENSWGDRGDHKGYYSMSDKWFDEFNYEIVVDKKYLDEDTLKILDTEVIELEPWDPFGALAGRA